MKRIKWLGVGFFVVSVLACSTLRQSGGCAAAGDGSYLIKAGYLVTGSGVITNGMVYVSGGRILDVGAFRPGAYPQALLLDYSGCAVTPGMINCHDHITYNQLAPSAEVQAAYAWKNPRYDQRQDWRKGKRGFTKIDCPSDTNAAVVSWGELRQLMAGTTTTLGSGGVKGLVRNLGGERPTDPQLSPLREGLVSKKAYFDVFPLGDSDGLQLAQGLAYASHPNPAVLTNVVYIPHVSEGVDQVARNEFLNLSSNASQTVDGKLYTSYDILSTNMLFIHMIALLHDDAVKVAGRGVTHIWSPRSNLSLYGNTAYVSLYRNLGMNICLSTDWSCSGSMNLLREYAAACYLNENYFDRTFSSKELWKMTTVNASRALQAGDSIGDLRVNMLADLIAVRVTVPDDLYASVIKSPVEDVALVMRGGKVLYGDAKIIRQAKLPPNAGGQWDAITVNGQDKLVDTLSETGYTLAALQAANTNSYPLFFNGAPPDEPVAYPIRGCDPLCTNASTYPIFPKTDDYDQDGVRDAQDNEPRIFNPLRPVDIINNAGQCPMH